MTVTHEAGPDTDARMSPLERRAAFSLAGIFSLRMLGLFMVLPVLSLHAHEYTGNTPVLAGLAIGIYGLSQAICQIPFGLLSDRIGRKPVIVGGLLVFALGSVVAAFAHSIMMVIVGRAMQGIGAISSAVMALAADLTRDSQRTKAMAVIGASIGMSFALALVLGPVFAKFGGLSTVFGTTAVLALGGIGVLLILVPTPSIVRHDRETRPALAEIGRVLGNPDLLRLDFGILILHSVMTATFVALPLLLRDDGGVPPGHHWMVYLFALVVSVLVMAPCVMHADRRDRLKQVFVGAIAVLALAQAGLFMAHMGAVLIIGWMVVYFSAFNVLEASLPSLVSRLAPASTKGTALGVYSTFQYLGAFIGGVSGGWLHARFGPPAVFGAGAALALVWVAFAIGMRNPRALSTLVLSLASDDDGYARRVAERLPGVPGVTEAVVMPEDGVAYLKFERGRLDRAALDAVLAPGGAA